jgi:hypothetical protein
MLGPAELREIAEALSEQRTEGGHSAAQTPYITPHFALGMALTRAAHGAGVKPYPSAILASR